MSKIFDVLARKVFESNGEKKIKWYKAGYIKETDNGTKYLRLFFVPETDYFIFEKEKLPHIPF
jgi:hypothetical protein